MLVNRSVPMIATLTICGVLGWLAAASNSAGQRLESDDAQARATENRNDIPIPDPTFKGVARRTLTGSKPDVPQPGEGTPGCPQRAARPGRRRRLRQPFDIRRPVPDAERSRSWPGRACATTGSTSRRCARRPGPRCSRAGTTMPSASARSRSSRADGRATTRPGPRAPPAIAKILQGNGYTTAAFGKWHLTPDDQQGAAGPFDRWPNGLGFDYFWGFLGGESGQYDPVLTENNTIIGVPKEKDYYFPDGHGQPHDPLDPRPESPVARQAVLHLLRPGRQPRPAPRPQGVGRQVQGQVRPGLGQAPRGDVRPAEGARRRSRPTPSSRRATRPSPPGTRSRRT